jgi:hypothetical protein
VRKPFIVCWKRHTPWFTKFEFEKCFSLFYIISTKGSYIYIKNWMLIAVLRNWEQFQICSVFQFWYTRYIPKSCNILMGILVRILDFGIYEGAHEHTACTYNLSYIYIRACLLAYLILVSREHVRSYMYQNPVTYPWDFYEDTGFWYIRGCSWAYWIFVHVWACLWVYLILLSHEHAHM